MPEVYISITGATVACDVVALRQSAPVDTLYKVLCKNVKRFIFLGLPA
jgi:hypothetical protein